MSLPWPCSQPRSARRRPTYRGPSTRGSARSSLYYNWTGFYAGINAGYGWGTSDWDLSSRSKRAQGFLVGGTLGYNYQTGSFVWGIEGDIAWSDVKGSSTAASASTCETANRWLGTTRGRLGYAFDRFLPYITGGAAFGSVRASINPGPVVSRDRHAAGLDRRRRP